MLRLRQTVGAMAAGLVMVLLGPQLAQAQQFYNPNLYSRTRTQMSNRAAARAAAKAALKKRQRAKERQRAKARPRISPRQQPKPLPRMVPSGDTR